MPCHARLNLGVRLVASLAVGDAGDVWTTNSGSRCVGSTAQTVTAQCRPRLSQGVEKGVEKGAERHAVARRSQVVAGTSDVPWRRTPSS